VTFAFVAMDQIVNQASKIHYMFGGQAKFPILFRAWSAAAATAPPSTRRARTRCS
jgi:pyruvate/2-oxoglutarate/acetoin dehydrogenase E1 component